MGRWLGASCPGFPAPRADELLAAGKAQETFTRAGTGRVGGAETAAEPNRVWPGAPGSAGARLGDPGGGRFRVAGREDGEPGEGRALAPPRPDPRPGAAQRRAQRAAAPVAALFPRAAGAGGPGGAFLGGRALGPHSTPPSLRLPGRAAGPMSGERREREAERAGPRPTAPVAAAPNASFCAPRLCAASRPLARSSVPREPGGRALPSGTAACAHSGGRTPSRGRGWGRLLPKMQDGSGAAVQPVLPHHGVHLSAPAQRAPGHPAGPGNCGRAARPRAVGVSAGTLPEPEREGSRGRARRGCVIYLRPRPMQISLLPD